MMTLLPFVRGRKWSALFKPHFTDEAELMEARIAVEKVTGFAPKVRPEWAQVDFPFDRQPLSSTDIHLRGI